MNDPVQHLRELMAKATPGPWILGEYQRPDWDVATGHGRGGGSFEIPRVWPDGRRGMACVSEIDTADAALIVAAINALPALLAVAEAARHHETVRNRNSLFEEYEASHTELQLALAKLDEVNHD